ncbi:cyclin-A3-2, putative [Entamoeba invadens IP1]|uniref:Cyclin-A3-2, putative n=1 Tax=Entamoeba invadens IP1 TaxID=370355 RepID=A0A0A1TZG5_ENTIV|nr:cyclin-A3-2, putative [Entamoeba invadens IP1]ELP85575.1 cyclin-A3-2, putative [Entamoeba invadens IP1]|eukprot:XP_004184921.1 cyclin-A3-2, putative [Entamoeba invadens IP1]
MCAQDRVSVVREPKSAFTPVELSIHCVVVEAEKKHKITTELQDFCRYLQIRQTQMPQPNLDIATPFMRPQLVDWLFKTCDFLKFHKKLVFQALTLADSYTTRTPVDGDELGLVFLTSLFSAAKYDAIAIKLNDVLKLCNYKYNNKEVIQMEMKILTSVSYKMDNPTPFDFLCLLWEAVGYPTFVYGKQNHPVVEASVLFLEVMSLDPIFLTNTPSSMAASAFFFARDLCHFTQLWESLQQKCLFLRKSDVKDVALDFVPKMRFCLENAESMGFKPCADFAHVINAHRLDHMNCVKHITSRSSKAMCFWDTNDLRNFD